MKRSLHGDTDRWDPWEIVEAVLGRNEPADHALEAIRRWEAIPDAMKRYSGALMVVATQPLEWIDDAWEAMARTRGAEALEAAAAEQLSGCVGRLCAVLGLAGALEQPVRADLEAGQVDLQDRSHALAVASLGHHLLVGVLVAEPLLHAAAVATGSHLKADRLVGKVLVRAYAKGGAWIRGLRLAAQRHSLVSWRGERVTGWGSWDRGEVAILEMDHGSLPLRAGPAAADADRSGMSPEARSDYWAALLRLLDRGPGKGWGLSAIESVIGVELDRIVAVAHGEARRLDGQRRRGEPRVAADRKVEGGERERVDSAGPLASLLASEEGSRLLALRRAEAAVLARAPRRKRAVWKAWCAGKTWEEAAKKGGTSIITARRDVDTITSDMHKLLMGKQ